MDLKSMIQLNIENLRTERNKLLKESDHLVLPDYPISEENLLIVKQYRKDLRNYFQQDDIINIQHYQLPEFPRLIFKYPL